MEKKQQVQITRTIFVEEVPSELKRLLSLSLSSFSMNVSKYSEDLEKLLAEENYSMFIEKLLEFRMNLMKADSVLEDCNIISKNYLSMMLGTEQQSKQTEPDFHSMLDTMNEQVEKTQDIKRRLEDGDV